MHAKAYITVGVTQLFCSWLYVVNMRVVDKTEYD